MNRAWPASALPGAIVGALLIAVSAQAQAPVGSPTTTATSTATATSVPASPIATPWPPPDVSLEQRVNILDENNFPIHPDVRTVTLSLSWPPQPNFTGSYEVQWVRVVPGTPREYQFLVILDPKATGGKLFELPVPFNDWRALQFCFRVRSFTLRPGAGLAADRESGPFSAEICTVQPISDGPLPPVVGTSLERPDAPFDKTPSVILAGTAMATVGVLLGASGLWRTARRHRRPHRTD